MPRFLRSLFKRRTTTSSPHAVLLNPNLVITRKKVKHARIMVHHDGTVHFVAPIRYADKRIAELLIKHDEWILRQRERFSKLARIEVPKGEVLYRGKCYRFVYRPSLHNEVWVDSDEMVICSGQDLLDTEILESWYKAEAERVFLRRVDVLSERNGFIYSKVRISSPKTIWGSCSSAQALSFNWRLIKAPPFVLDYLVLHELVHTKVKDHSHRFWKAVEEVCPRYKEAVEWLKTYGRWI